MKLEYGEMNRLSVLKETDISYTLTNGTETVFLHFNQTPNPLKIGQKVDAFLYFDQKKRLCATLEKPVITKNKPGFVEVVNVVEAGVFVNIGIQKDILVSNDYLPSNKKAWPVVGDKIPCIIRVKTNQLVARPIDTTDHFYKELLNVNDKVKGTVVSVNNNGILVATDAFQVVFINKNLIRKDVKIGEELEVKVIEVNNSIMYGSTILQKELSRLSDSDMILNYLKQLGGMVPLGNMSDPDDIYKVFHMSKGAFKRACGHLYKNKLIKIEDYRILLVEK